MTCEPSQVSGQRRLGFSGFIQEGRLVAHQRVAMLVALTTEYRTRMIEARAPPVYYACFLTPGESKMDNSSGTSRRGSLIGEGVMNPENG